MALSEDKIQSYTKRLLLSRMRILYNHGFYGLLLMHMIYNVSEEVKTACTDGVRITFGTEFLDSLTDAELDFIMMHEILHVVLQHCIRGDVEDPEKYNIAADIVVNSNIMLENGMKESSITLSKYGTLMHLAPNGKEGHEYTAEQVYAMLPKNPNIKNVTWDDHSQWGKNDDIHDIWVKWVNDAAEAIKTRGLLPAFAERILKELKNPQTDWRTILNDFVQEEVVDYSFAPPDRRFDDCPFFLPDFNDKENMVENILFMIDTSGSISDDMITAAYSEIKGAIDQFDGKLKGWLGFFDAAIIEPQPFEDEEDFRIIKPIGGGGTDFEIIFKYVMDHMQDRLPASIIILTDGYAPFPQETLANGIPVLWLLNNKEVNPPWGKVARIEV